MLRKSARALSFSPGENIRSKAKPIRLTTPSKYRAVRTEIDNITFASKREAARYAELRLLERAGIITGLQLQPSFPLTVEGETLGAYRADFSYVENGQFVIEDVKGVKTPMYRWKAKHLRAQYGVTIRET
jgi:hypothetical protein